MKKYILIICFVVISLLTINAQTATTDTTNTASTTATSNGPSNVTTANSQITEVRT